MSFRIGGKVVYPAHGVAYIKDIKQLEVSGVNVDFYILQVMASGMRVMIPVSAAEDSMRHIIDAYEVDQIFGILKTPTTIAQQAWNRRFREFSEKIGASSILEVVEVLRDLWILKRKKELSFGEKLMFERAINLIKEEVAISIDINQDIAEQKILQCLEASHKHHQDIMIPE
ncbi:MAG: CarD family transcriptional regulator [Proteobacteria bacterium]|nr:CarD family transcriptional regulator [Pseudomonadota bacterium]